jgi:hypothetical protein
MSENAVATAADDSSVISTTRTARIVVMKQLIGKDLKGDGEGNPTVCWLMSRAPGRAVVVQSPNPVFHAAFYTLVYEDALCVHRMPCCDTSQTPVSSLAPYVCQTLSGSVCYTLHQTVPPTEAQYRSQGDRGKVLRNVNLNVSASALGKSMLLFPRARARRYLHQTSCSFHSSDYTHHRTTMTVFQFLP